MNKFETYLIFTREQFEISATMKFYHQLQTIPNDEESFIQFIKNWVEISKKDKSYINIYKICLDERQKEPIPYYIDKITWIKQGELYTL